MAHERSVRFSAANAMSFIDNITKKVTQGVERAKFEADKLQRTLRLETELNDLKKQVDGKRLEFGDRALELFKAGKIQSPTLGEILRAIEGLQVRVTLKEEELKLSQADTYTETPGFTPPAAQQVPISVAPQQTQPPPSYTAPAPTPPSYTPPAPNPAPQASTKTCANCGFQMPATAQFCPSCGTRISGV